MPTDSHDPGCGLRRTRSHRPWWRLLGLTALALLLAACGGDGDGGGTFNTGGDSGGDTGGDSGGDTGPGTGSDTGTPTPEPEPGDDADVLVLGLEDTFIPDGDDTPDAVDGTLFSELVVAVPANSESHDFTLTNASTETLNILGFSVSDTEHFTITPADPSRTTLTPEASLAFTITYTTADDAGTHQALAAIDYNLAGGDTRTYDFAVEGSGKGPHIELFGLIPDGADGFTEVAISDPDTGAPTIAPSRDNRTDFGRLNIGSDTTPVTDIHRFRIKNTGNAELELISGNVIEIGSATNVAPGANDRAHWRVFETPSNTTLAPGASLDFQLQVTSHLTGETDADWPAKGDANGERLDAVIRIDNTDPSPARSSFRFNIQLVRYRTALTVFGADPAVLDNTVYHEADRVYIGNNTDFASVPLDGEATHDFVIRNDGPNPVALTGQPTISVVGSFVTDFEILNAPADGTVLAPGATAGYSIRFRPSTLGLIENDVQIPNDDPVLAVAPDDDERFLYPVAGRGSGPRLEVREVDSDLAVERDDLEPDAADGTRMPSAYIEPPNNAQCRRFQVTNIGNETLTFTDSLRAIKVLNQTDEAGHGEGFSEDPDYFINYEWNGNVKQDILPDLPWQGTFERTPGGTDDREFVTKLDPGESAFFDLVFAPNGIVALSPEPERSLRQGIVAIETDEPPPADSLDPDAFLFGVAGEALDPIMTVRGKSLIVQDEEGASGPKETWIDDVDHYGGTVSREYVVRNEGIETTVFLEEGGAVGTNFFWQPERTGPIWTSEAYPSIKDPANSDITIENVFQISGSPRGPGAHAASILSRLRIGDTVEVHGGRINGGQTGRIVYLWPNFAWSPGLGPKPDEILPSTLWRPSAILDVATLGLQRYLELESTDSRFARFGQYDIPRLDEQYWDHPIEGVIQVDFPVQSTDVPATILLGQTDPADSKQGVMTFAPDFDLGNIAGPDTFGLRVGDWIQIDGGNNGPNQNGNYEVIGVNVGAGTATVCLVDPSSTSLTQSLAAKTFTPTVVAIDRTTPDQHAFTIADTAVNRLDLDRVTENMAVDWDQDGVAYSVRSVDVDTLTIVVNEAITAGLSGGQLSMTLPPEGTATPTVVNAERVEEGSDVFLLEDSRANRRMLDRLVPGVTFTWSDTGNGVVYTVDSVSSENVSITIREDIQGTTEAGGTLSISLPRHVTIHVREDLYITKNDWELDDSQLAASLEPGEETSFRMRFTPRWSTGHPADWTAWADRTRAKISGSGIVPPPGTNWSRAPWANGGDAPDGDLSTHFVPDFAVEVNIVTNDTDMRSLPRHSDRPTAFGGEYTSTNAGVAHEMVVYGRARDPDINVDYDSDGSGDIDASDVAMVPGQQILFPTTAEGASSGWILFEVQNEQSVAEMAGLLKLDTGAPEQITGPAAEDFELEVLDSVRHLPQFDGVHGGSTVHRFRVRFTPAGQGERRATLEIPTNDRDVNHSPFVINLSGQATAPASKINN